MGLGCREGDCLVCPVKKLSALVGAVLLAAIPAFGQTPAPSAPVEATPSGTVYTRLANWMGYFPNPRGFFGAVGDGSTDDTAAITSALGLSTRSWMPYGSYLTTLGQGSIPGPLMGPGQVITSDGNKRGPIVVQIQSAPSSLGDWSSVLTAFNGDLSHVEFGIEHRITGATTLTQPTSGYVFTPETSGFAEYFYNSSGWNNGTADNTGRTGAVMHTEYGAQAGQGDLIMRLCSLITTGTRAGATSFLASPASSCLAGSNAAGNDGVYLQVLGDLNTKDNGHDVSAISLGAFNMNRANDTGALGTFWAGERFQSVGTKPIDAFWSAVGPSTHGIDMVGASFSTIQLAVISLTGGGSGFAMNDTITLTGGTCDQEPILNVDTLSTTAIATFHVVRSGICSVAPSTTPTWTTSGAGTGATFSAVFAANAAIVMAPGSTIYGHATNSTASHFPNATQLGVDGQISFPTGGITIGRDNQNAAGSGGANEILIGYDHQALGTNTIVLGQQGYDKARSNVLVFASGQTSARGDTQTVTQILHRTTTNTSPVPLSVGGGSASGTNIVNIQMNTVFQLQVTCVARDVTTGDTATWDMVQGTLSRVTGNAAYAGAETSATAPTRSTGSGSTATIQLSADTTNQGLTIGWTAPNSDTWHPACKVDSLEVQ